MPRINLYGPIGLVTYDGDGVLSKDVVELVAMAEGDLDVHVNSPGGIAMEGVAIFNALRAYDRGQVKLTVDAVAASAASLIAMAGDEIVMAEGAVMMIHDPSAITIGPADAHRKTAGVLDKLSDVYAGIYARRSKNEAATVRDMMVAETWMTAAEAVENGFADQAAEMAAAEPTAFDWRKFRHAPEWLAERSVDIKAAWATATTGTKEITVPQNVQTAPAAAGATAAATVDPIVSATAATTTANVDPETISAAVKAERQRAREIRAAAANFKLSSTFVDDLIDSGLPLAEAKAKIVDQLASVDDGYPQINALRIEGGVDEREKFVAGATKALMAKAGLKGGERNEFSSYRLDGLARAYLDRSGNRRAFRDQLSMVSASFQPTMSGGMHTTSDFANILENVMNKSMLAGWEEAPETYQLWTRAGNATDFRPQKRVGLNIFPSLDVVPEGAEYTFGTIGDRGESILIATYGKMVAVTRQLIINDDMDALSRLPRSMGRAARRTIGNLAYAVLTANAAMSDTIALFHADHGNLAGSGAAPATATFDAARTAMAVQQDPDEHATGGLNISPRYWIGPKALEGKAKVVVESETEIGASQNNSRVPNSVRGMVEVIADARLDTASTYAWYMAGDPNLHDTIEVAYLDGVQEPTLEQQEGWRVDGAEFKVRIDAGVKALDFRALYKNPGQ